MESIKVIKIGGNVIDDPASLSDFLQAFSDLPGHKILVHGGGKIATEIAKKMGIEAQMVDGRRITDQPMLEIITMVYGGLVNKNMVAKLQSMNCDAIGLTGADGNLIKARKRPVKNVDFGYVGDVSSGEVNLNLLTTLLNQSLVPVLAPLTHDHHGQLLNTNADTIASVVARALAKAFDVTLVYCFEKAGVLSDPLDEASVIGEITLADYEDLKASGTITGGMIPKIDNAMDALLAGVGKVIIGSAQSINRQSGSFTTIKLKS